MNLPSAQAPPRSEDASWPDLARTGFVVRAQSADSSLCWASDVPLMLAYPGPAASRQTTSITIVVVLSVIRDHLEKTIATATAARQTVTTAPCQPSRSAGSARFGALGQCTALGDDDEVLASSATLTAVRPAKSLCTRTKPHIWDCAGGLPFNPGKETKTLLP